MVGDFGPFGENFARLYCKELGVDEPVYCRSILSKASSTIEVTYRTKDDKETQSRTVELGEALDLMAKYILQSLKGK